jgi:hypothetical protein
MFYIYRLTNEIIQSKLSIDIYCRDSLEKKMSAGPRIDLLVQQKHQENGLYESLQHEHKK